jgi:hypothetical protein
MVSSLIYPFSDSVGNRSQVRMMFKSSPEEARIYLRGQLTSINIYAVGDVPVRAVTQLDPLRRSS